MSEDCTEGIQDDGRGRLYTYAGRKLCYTRRKLYESNQGCLVSAGLLHRSRDRDRSKKSQKEFFLVRWGIAHIHSVAELNSLFITKDGYVLFGWKRWKGFEKHTYVYTARSLGATREETLQDLSHENEKVTRRREAISRCG
jgi:hypothetical protein